MLATTLLSLRRQISLHQCSDTVSTAPIPEPDFPLSLSEKAFFEETLRRPEDFVGRPDESMWTNKEKIENYEVIWNEIDDNNWTCKVTTNLTLHHVVKEVIQHLPTPISSSSDYERTSGPKRKNIFDEYLIPKRHCNERAVTAIGDYIAYDGDL